MPNLGSSRVTLQLTWLPVIYSLRDTCNCMNFLDTHVPYFWNTAHHFLGCPSTRNICCIFVECLSNLLLCNFWTPQFLFLKIRRAMIFLGLSFWVEKLLLFTFFSNSLYERKTSKCRGLPLSWANQLYLMQAGYVVTGSFSLAC